MSSSVLGRPLDPVEVVSDRIMAAKLSVLLKNTSHPVQHTLTALIISPSVTGHCILEDETSEPFPLSCCQTQETTCTHWGLKSKCNTAAMHLKMGKYIIYT